jgi:Arc/MetJ-type ribon-helix-helix transcriptional regulator
MDQQLSPQNEEYLERIVAGGIFPSKAAAIDAAVTALREKSGEIPFVPDEHMDAVEHGIAQADAGLCEPMTAEDWASLRQYARDCAGKTQGGG